MPGYTWEPYGEGYIISHAGGGCHVASVCEVALIREVERLERERDAMREVAIGRQPHINQGECPDIWGFEHRDESCPACRILGPANDSDAYAVS